MQKLNFGSGRDYKEGWVNADMRGADLNFDFEKFPYPIKDNAYDYIYTSDVLDHLKDYFAVMRELHRILKPDGILEIRVPFFNCQTSWMSTHFQHFSLVHFSHYTPDIRKTFTEENSEDFGKACFQIESFRTEGVWWIPDWKIGKYVTIRYWVALRIGEIVQRLHVKMRPIK